MAQARGALCDRCRNDGKLSIERRASEQATNKATFRSTAAQSFGKVYNRLFHEGVRLEGYSMFECLFDSCCLFHDCLAGCLSVLTVVSGLRFERCLSVNTRPKVLINTTAFIHIAINSSRALSTLVPGTVHVISTQSQTDTKSTLTDTRSNSRETDSRRRTDICHSTPTDRSVRYCTVRYSYCTVGV